MSSNLPRTPLELLATRKSPISCSITLLIAVEIVVTMLKRLSSDSPYQKDDPLLLSQLGQV